MKYKELGYIVEKQRNEDEYRVIISTDGVDRGGDQIVSTGINYDTYMASNPVILFGHGRDPVVGSAPIGRATSLKTFAHKVESKFVFAENDVQASRIKNLWEQDIIRTASVGIIPLKTEDMPVKDKDDMWAQMFPPQRILESELVEFSLVSIPMNSAAVKKELDAQLMKLLELIEAKLAPVEEILKKAQEIDQKIELLKKIEEKEVEKGFVPYVQYQYCDEEWDASFLKENANTDYSFVYAYGSFAPHHVVKDGTIMTSKHAVIMGLALINGSVKDIEGAREAYEHLQKHLNEMAVKTSVNVPDYAYKQWTPLQTVSFLRSEKVLEDNILLTLTECGIELSEALKYVKIAEPIEEKSDSTSDEYDTFLKEILESCKSIVELVG